MLRSTADPVAEDVQQLEWTQSPTPVVDEDGGQFGLAIGIIDVEDGAVASSDIDISSASVELAKSTGGGAFSTTGITQPSLSKSQGVVVLESDFAASEWAAGDSYRVAVSGIVATTGDGNDVELPEQRWYGAVSEESDITSQINTLHNTRIPDTLSLANIQGEAEDALLADLSADSPAASSVVDVLANDVEPRMPGSGTLSTHSWDPDSVVPSSGTLTTANADPTTGTLSADGTEQTVFTINPSTMGSGVYFVDLSNMASGDTVVVREKVDVDNDGTFSIFAETTFSDAQTEPVVGPSTDFLAHSSVPVRVTLEQTGGTNRDYDFAHGVDK